MLQLAGAIEFLLEQLSLQTIGMAGALHDGPVGHGFAAHEQGDPDDPSLPTTAISADAPSSMT
jgi:hypothetical protein